MVTRPSVPPYSSTTSAMWMCVDCMRISRLAAGIDGGTKIIGRRSLVEAMGLDRSARPRSGTAASRGSRGAICGRSPARCARRADCTWPSLAGRPRASPISQRIRSLMCTMPRGSSSVSRNSGMRETPAASKVFSSSRIGSFSSTAMMSARGTMTSTTRRAPKRRMRSSISRSSTEKAWPSPAPLSASSSVARSVGAPGRPSRARRAASQLCGCSPAGSSDRPARPHPACR